jgi:ketosteroid isomerase-like protein
VVEAADLDRFRSAFEALSQGDLDAAGDLVTEDYVVDDHTVPEDTTGPRGPEAVRALLARLRESFDDYRFELLEMTGLGDGRVLAVIRTSGTGHGSQIEMEGQVGEINVIRDGLVARTDIYPSPDEARRAAGLEA